METRIHSSINDIGADAWDAVAEPRLICSHRYLKAIESSKINDCRYFYPVVYEDGRIIAHTCVYFISTELDIFARGIMKRGVSAARRIWPGFMILRSLECGTPVALGSTISFAEDSDRSSVLASLVPAIEGVARNLGVGVLLFRDFEDCSLGVFDRICTFDYRRIPNLSCARMKVPWHTMEEYAASMRSEYRRKMKARVDRFRSGKGRLELIRDFSVEAADLARLWKNSYDHAHEYRREMLLQDFFENIDRGLGDDSMVLVASVGDRKAGFCLLLRDNRTLIWLFCGLDYELNGQYGIYYSMMYEIVRLAMAGGYEEIDLGITTLEPKMDIGATVVPLHMYMKHLDRRLNLFVPRLFEKMTPVPGTRSRKVFRQS